MFFIEKHHLHLLEICCYVLLSISLATCHQLSYDLSLSLRNSSSTPNDSSLSLWQLVSLSISSLPLWWLITISQNPSPPTSLYFSGNWSLTLSDPSPTPIDSSLSLPWLITIPQQFLPNSQWLISTSLATCFACTFVFSNYIFQPLSLR